MRKLKRFTASLVLAIAATAMMVSAASAAPGDIVWSSPSSSWSGSLTYKHNGTGAVTCTFPTSSNLFGVDEPNSFRGTSLNGAGYWYVTCPSTTITLLPRASLYYEAGFHFELWDATGEFSGFSQSPWSDRGWLPNAISGVPFTNASGLTPSHLTFSETEIGLTDRGETVTASGTLNAKTLNGKENVTLKVE